MGNVLKIIITGLITTAVRIIGRLSIPAGEQTVLGPSLAERHHADGILHLRCFAYSIIASMFLLIRDTLSGNRLLQGLKYGAACTVSGPSIYGASASCGFMDHHLPSCGQPRTSGHGTAPEGAFFGNDPDMASRSGRERVFNIISFCISVAACFISGPSGAILVFDIYSSFAERPF